MYDYVGLEKHAIEEEERCETKVPEPYIDFGIQQRPQLKGWTGESRKSASEAGRVGGV